MKWLRGWIGRSMMDNWQRWEYQAARALGLDITITSGNKFFDPGDATSRGRGDPFPLLVDCKLTERGSFSLNAQTMRHYAQRAAEAGKRFVLALRYSMRKGSYEEDYVVLSFHDFSELLDLARGGTQ